VSGHWRRDGHRRRCVSPLGRAAISCSPGGRDGTSSARRCHSPAAVAAPRSPLGYADRVLRRAVRRPARVRGGGRRGCRPYPPPPGTFARAAGGGTSPPQYTPRSPLSPVPARAQPRVSRP
jgi:hypothetical protein